MRHLCGFYASVDQAAAYTAMAALADPTLFVSGNDLHIPDGMTNILSVAAGLSNGGQANARLTSPSLRGKVRFFVEPVNNFTDADAVADIYPVVHDLRENPIVLTAREVLNCDTHADPTLARRQWVLIELADAVPAAVKAPVYSLRFTGTTTLVAGAWTNGTITPDDSIPAGKWNVVGLRARSTGLIAARLFFPGQAYRPGALGVTTQARITHPMWRYGAPGVLGTFDLDTIPTVDYLSNSADTAEVLYLDITPAA